MPPTDDFIRTALAVALSDGLLSVEEVALLRRWGMFSRQDRSRCDTGSTTCSLMSRRSPDF
ncbi:MULTISPECIES: TerB family tellurite resistance protein [unclassified Synechococcus]|uniref:TerB family tellurite resistance protein n=1 Tax=unclassified Synechococcus TaxID=2626047 RepID=UPI0000698E9F|nr:MULTISPECIES: TerB family tellurite resistance protein [unclassified Synechococcus]EAQ73938.1 hypothetical protein WH5701_09885 [Synechococcus sp. WH 5701]WFN60633.1 TerB family tellurite resistance protein [Synechococcus sp. CCFWC 502]